MYRLGLRATRRQGVNDRPESRPTGHFEEKPPTHGLVQQPQFSQHFVGLSGEPRKGVELPHLELAGVRGAPEVVHSAGVSLPAQ